MKHKIIVLIMTLCLILPTCNIVWADSSNTSEIVETLNNSTATSTQTPLVSESEVAAVVENVQVEEQVEDETPAMQFPHTVTIYFYYRNSQGQFISQKASNTFKKESDGWSKAVSYFEKQITNNHLETVNSGLTIYTFTGEWVGDNGQVLTSADRVSIKGDTYGQDTVLNFYAQYTEENCAQLTMNYIDKIAHGSSSWSNEGTFEGYTHTFKTPADVPEHYQFVYWKNLQTEETYVEEDSIQVDRKNLTEDTTIDIYAIWQPSVIINYYLGEELVKSIESFESIKVYDYIPDIEENQEFNGWYLEEELVNEEEIYSAPEQTIDGEYKVYNIYGEIEEIVVPVEPEPESEPTPEPEPEPIIEPIVEPPAQVDPPTNVEVRPVVVVETTTPITSVQEQPARGASTFKTPVEAPKSQVTTIENIEIPKGINGSWALINLISTIITVLLSLLLIIFALLNKLDEDKDKKVKNKIILRIITIIIAFISIIIFVLTENITLPMVLFDKYTIWMILILIIQIVIAFLSRHKVKDEDEE